MVQDVRPSTPHGRPAKAVVGELTPVTANIFREGHDVLAARALLRRGAEVVSACAMTNTGTTSGRPPSGLWNRPPRAGDRGMDGPVRHVGSQSRHQVGRSRRGQDRGGGAYGPLVGGSPGREDPNRPGERGTAPTILTSVAKALAALSNRELDDASRISMALSAPVARALSGPRLAADLTVAAPVPLWVDRQRASVGAWYELFPRSFGGLRGAAARSPGWRRWASTSCTSPPSTP